MRGTHAESEFAHLEWHGMQELSGNSPMKIKEAKPLPSSD